MSLTLSSGYIFADCFLRSDNALSAQIGIGNYVFGFTLNLDVKKSEKYERILLDLEGHISLNGKIIAPISSIDGPMNIHANLNHGYSNTKSFRAILSRACIEEIEIERRGGDLAFEIYLSGLVLGGEAKAEKVHTTVSCRIEQTQWLKLLTAWKFGDRVFLEIPIADAKSEMLSGFEYFKKAQSLFLSGHWEQSVAECRKSLDSMHVTMNKGASLQTLLQKKKDNSLQDRILVFILSIKQICDPASHGDDNSVSIDWGRSDAEMVLLQTASCLQRVARL